LPCITFTDVYPSQYFYRAVDWLYCHGFISGYPDNTFRPNNPATRAQLIKIDVLSHAWPPVTPPAPSFSDVGPSQWHYAYIETAVLHSVISGYPDGTFRPNNNITRAQLSKIIVLSSQWPLVNPPIPSFSDVPTTSPFYAYIETARNHNLISGYGDGTFRPNNNATRAQLSKIIYTALTQPGKQ